jgi:hypothetical protein
VGRCGEKGHEPVDVICRRVSESSEQQAAAAAQFIIFNNKNPSNAPPRKLLKLRPKPRTIHPSQQKTTQIDIIKYNIIKYNMIKMGVIRSIFPRVKCSDWQWPK